MNRREFITLLGGAAAAWPLVARAQQRAMPIVGILGGHTSAEWTPFIAAFNLGLKVVGFVEGQNVHIEYRWAEGHYDQLPALAADLVRSRVAVIVAVGGVNSAAAAKAATEEMPIIFLTGRDPIELGFVKSFNRPGGNLTGINLQNAELEPKRLELLRELVPNASKIALLINPEKTTSRASATCRRQVRRQGGRSWRMAQQPAMPATIRSFCSPLQARRRPAPVNTSNRRTRSALDLGKSSVSDTCLTSSTSENPD
jgi:putative tryptophan/tyrosine transport system substrate-binding protein